MRRGRLAFGRRTPPLASPAAPGGPRPPEPGRIYHRRNRARSRPYATRRIAPSGDTPKSTVASPSPPGTRHPPAEAAQLPYSALPGVPRSVLETNEPSTATTRLRSRAGVLRLEKPFSASSRRRPLALGQPASPLLPS